MAKKSNSQTAAGMFNFSSMMEDYYGYSPGDSDDAGRASKRAFQENMIQSAFDSQLAMQNAAMAQEFELDAAKTYGDLELRNQKQLMNDTFKYGMQKMDQEYNYQSRFAVDEAKRNLDTMSHAGNVQANQTKLEGIENRLTIGEQGKQTRLNIGAQADADIKTMGGTKRDYQKDALESAERSIGLAGAEERKNIAASGAEALKQIDAGASADIRRNVETVSADVQRAKDITGGTSRDVQKDALESQERMQKESGIQALDQIGASGAEAVKQIGAQAQADQGTTRVAGEESRKNIGAQSDADVRSIGATSDADVRNIAAQSDSNVRGIAAQGEVDVTKLTTQGGIDKDLLGIKGDQALAQIGATGTETRTTMDKQNEIDAKKENRSEARSRALARR